MVIQILVTLFVFVIILPGLYSSFKKKNLGLAGTIIWGIFWLAGLVVIWFPSLIGLIGKILGVERSIDGLIYISIVFLLHFSLKQRIRINEIEKEITMLGRKVALKDIKKKGKENEKK